MSLIWMPPHTTTPPLRTALSAAGTSAPTGAKMMAASSGVGRRLDRNRRPTQRRAGVAKACAASSPGRVKA